VRRLRARADPCDPTTLLVEGREVHHAVHVLRLHPGDRFVAFDGLGGEWEAELVERGPVLRARVVRPLPAVRVPYHLTLYQGVPRGDRMDLVVRMGTELGVSAFVPVRTRRSVARGDRSARWRRVAEEAAKQCRRATVPSVEAPLEFPQAVERFARHARRVVLWEGGGAPLPEVLARPGVRELAVFVGPEGGFDPQEVDALQAVGEACSLGPVVLRTETAGVAAAAVVLACWGFTSAA